MDSHEKGRIYQNTKRKKRTEKRTEGKRREAKMRRERKEMIRR